MSGFVEVIGYFAFFWLFVFNTRFRRALIQEWANGGFIERTGLVLEGTFSFLVGVVAPLVLLASFVTWP
ncbi:hypothetical protein [Uliginosibacterium sp. TH139]|uniref:hypothetical protein n=1 Tax=Uliginosibacterium sp. TH139 TaxID=2067453 RepID=UPI000C7BB47E|nr:hypothetical protein [Uliginosibacterium sp. TH139]PLK50398.1 hypothetical protein C0V76_00780 [Uliginosibacterium sp. TH139]